MLFQQSDWHRGWKVNPFFGLFVVHVAANHVHVNRSYSDDFAVI